MSTLLVNQPFGCGDLIWEQTLVRRLADGRKILWPIFPHFVAGFCRAYPDINWVPFDSVPFDSNRLDHYTVDIGDYGSCEVIPLRHADTIMKVPYNRCMESKWIWANMDYRQWKEQAMWKRDEQKENELFQLLGCHEGDYNLINSIFGSYSQLKREIQVNNGLKNVHMTTIDSYSLFDYAKVIENASTINVVSSSILYLLELLDIKAPHVDLYCRTPIEKDFTTVDYIFEKHKYNLHY
jgi:hypothetical protein